MTQQELEKPFAPTLGADGEPCAECGAPLAHDQRYCLNCGRRRTAARIPFLEILREEQANALEAARAQAEQPAEEEVKPISAQVAAAVVGGLLLLVMVGVLIGALVGGGDSGTGAPQVLTVGGGAGLQASAATTPFQSDWPQGKDGWTVQLQTLPNNTTTPDGVTAAKTAATGKGAPDVGALNSDDYTSLDPGSYVVYSGVFDKKKQAAAALKKLKKDFPDAKVIQVNGDKGSGVADKGGDPDALSGRKKEAVVDRSQLQQLQNLPPDQYSKAARKLPDTTILPGKPPPKDDKKPGAGSSGTTIK